MRLAFLDPLLAVIALSTGNETISETDATRCHEGHMSSWQEMRQSPRTLKVGLSLLARAPACATPHNFVQPRCRATDPRTISAAMTLACCTMDILEETYV